MTNRRIIVYSDESAKKGKYYSNFYGASLVLSENVHIIEKRLQNIQQQQGLNDEIKWNNISASNYTRYLFLVDEIFNLIDEKLMRTRIMFTHNTQRPIGLTKEHRQEAYFILYYQFIKHGLGLKYYNNENGPRDLQLICDQFPNTGKQVDIFKKNIINFNSKGFLKSGITLKLELIGEAKSHSHIILQATDLILGSINFRLNDLHKAKPDGKFRRGKKTKAKEEVFKKISSRIRNTYPNFNIGISTGHRNDMSNRWNDPYRHWCFKTANTIYDKTAEK